MIRNVVRRFTLPVLLLTAISAAFPQSRSMTQGPHRMEIMLERHQGGTWHTIDPGLVLAQGDQVRFRFRTNFDGYLYVTNQNSSGTYQQLFPRLETGQDNHITANHEYQVPATTSTVFTIAGPAGYETVYWLVTPGRLSEAPPRFEPVPPDYKSTPPVLTPRCDDTIWRSRGDCIDHSAGPNLVPRDVELPQTLAQAAGVGRRDLVFMRQNDKAVISSPAPLTGPVIYEFRLAHR
ncbi:MAG: DUF4384 domain-containing protein [Acidobacteriia bacterium]|nr:DUF4384 domain-containing protein [Terriglobia bacterium]